MKCIILLISILNLFNVECSKERIIFIRSYIKNFNYKIIKDKDSSNKIQEPTVEGKQKDNSNNHEDFIITGQKDYKIELNVDGEKIECIIFKSFLSPYETKPLCDKNPKIRYGKEKEIWGIIIGQKTRRRHHK